MLNLFAAIKNNNLSYVANNLRFLELTYEKFFLALMIAPTPEMVKALILGVRMIETTPYIRLFRAAINAEYSVVNEILERNEIEGELLSILNQSISDQYIIKMLKFYIEKQ